ncbi:hypothetical protein RN001_000023 [Aquatica leii]|uniref:Uncharacterized protein n=1 Tax=Aquatica leii TaxID=1421715 RepID=A0AAN7PEB1_9COLE|nr:hypothetical protein RN001_000023 [Aquatica leii]
MYSYTIYCALFICCAQVFSIKIPDALYDQHTLECMEKTNIDKAFIEKSFDEKFHVVKGDAKVNEYLSCLGKTKGLINDDGKLNPTLIYDTNMNIINILVEKNEDKHDLATEVTDECINSTGDNYGDMIANLHDCVVDAFAKHNVTIFPN